MQLLHTKLHIPRLTGPKGIVPRNNLIHLLNTGLKKTLILIQAPAGFGKTTLLSQWIFENRFTKRTCWISLDRADNHPLRFWSYVFESLDRTVPGTFQPARARLQAGEADHIEDTLISMINDIETLDTPLILVLDDFHLIDSPDIGHGLNFLLDHMSRNLLMILSTRHKPGLELSRLRVSDRLMTLEESHLKFSKAEMNDFFSRCADKRLTSRQQQILYKKTEGWAAGIKLACFIPPGKKTPTKNNGFEKIPHIHEYFWEQAFNGLPDELQSFLVTVSVLDRFHADLCQTITNDHQTHAHLEFLKQNRFFITALDDRGHWYRFHHLFLEFLRSLIPAATAVRRTDIHHRACLWFRDNNHFDEAFSHALAADREDLAADIFADRISELYGRGSEESLYPYFNRLSRHVILSNLILAGYDFATQIYSGHFEKLDEMKQILNTARNNRDKRIFKGFYLAFTAYRTFYVDGDLTTAAHQAGTALDLIPGHHGSMRRMVEFIQTISLRYSGQLKAAMRICSRKQTDDLLMATLAVSNQADLDIELGRLTAARRLVKNQLRDLESVFGDRLPPSIFGFLYMIMGKILKEQNKKEAAEQTFAKGLKILSSTKFIELIVISYGEYSDFLTGCKQFTMAHKAVDKAIRYARQSFSWVEHMLIAQKHKIHLRQGTLEPVRNWAARFHIHPDLSVPFHQSFEYLVLCRYLIEIRAFEQAIAILDPMIEKDLEDGRKRRLLECYILKAKIRYRQQDIQAAVELIIRAFGLAGNQGYAAVFLEEAPGMENLYRHCYQDKTLPAGLVPHFDFLTSSPEKSTVKQVRIHDYIEELNTRELDILRLFKKGLSNKETAEQLCLSVNTVRWYASRIFAKLDVKRRGQAVSKAESLQLI